MKNNYKFIKAAAVGLLIAVSAFAASGTRYMAQPGVSKVKIEGTSTVHDWIMEGQLIGGHIELAPGIEFDPSKETIVGWEPGRTNNITATVVIPVRSVKSGKNSMDEVMQEAMKEKQHPRITFRLAEMEPVTPREPGQPFAFTAKGDLTVSGVTKRIAMPVTIEPVAPGKLKVSGKADLLMTDFGISPPAPKLALGFLKTGDKVTVSFEWVTRKAAAKS